MSKLRQSTFFLNSTLYILTYLQFLLKNTDFYVYLKTALNLNNIIYKCVLMNEWPRDMISENLSRVISGNQCVV
jgi:hypothetical protein